MNTTTKEIDRAAKRAVTRIWENLDDRRGFNLDSIDDEIQKEIRAELVEIIAAEIASLAK